MKKKRKKKYIYEKAKRNKHEEKQNEKVIKEDKIKRNLLFKILQP